MAKTKTTSRKRKAPAKKSATTSTQPFDVIASQHFATWLAGQGIGLAVSTYQASKLFLLGLNAEGGLSVAERTLDRCMGVTSAARSLYVASRWQIWRFENALRAGEVKDGFDAVFVPKSSHVTGDIDCHEMAIDGDGRLVFVNTLFNCISYLSRDYSFHPVWRPDFISDYVPEDRCHLNGLAMEDGRPAYVTAISKSNEADGWRKERADGGVIIDVRSNEIVCDGLSMPHSPRMHGRTLWVLDSGTGYLGRVDLDMKTFEPVTLCPGYLRGMTIVGNCAVVCISKARDSENFGDLAWQENLDAHKTEARCGLLVIDLTSGNILHWLRIEGVVTELFGVVALQGIKRPSAVGFQSDDIARTISLPPELD